ncbi:deoxynucleotidyltransferase terminal-interacting protein 2-like [Symsagittifera roscoffensis]|uniref:deoxynucleotidyltransferase terminal-interacting protein 2-like n=1 Tax=Symsagittifera roscoffensis TaxID=84072 RepID=UPI00307BCB4B
MNKPKYDKLIIEIDSESETDPSDYEGIAEADFHQVVRVDRTHRVHRVPIRKTDSRSTSDIGLQFEPNEDGHSETNDDSETNSSDNSFSDDQVKVKTVDSNKRNVSKLTRRKLTKRLQEVKRDQKRISPEFQLEENYRTQYETKPQHNKAVLWVPYIPENEFDKPTVFDPSNPSQFSSMMQMFQTVMTDGRILSREQIELFMTSEQNQSEKHSTNFQKKAFQNQPPDPNIPREKRSRRYSNQFIRRVSRSNHSNSNTLNQVIEIGDCSFSQSSNQRPQIDVAVNLNLGNKHSSKANAIGQITSKGGNNQRFEVNHENKHELIETDGHNESENPSSELNLGKIEKKRRRKVIKTNTGSEMIRGVKELPRSLGPDWTEVQKKAESLNRRNMYSRMVSVKNSQLPTLNRAPERSTHLSKRQIAQEYAKGASVYVYK